MREEVPPQISVAPVRLLHIESKNSDEEANGCVLSEGVGRKRSRRPPMNSLMGTSGLGPTVTALSSESVRNRIAVFRRSVSTE